MTDSKVAVTPGDGANIDTRTESTNSNHRQVIVIGDPSDNDGVAPVDGTTGLAVDIKAISSGLTIGHNVTGLVSGRKVVASAGTAEALVASSTPCKRVDIAAETNNTGVIAVGSAGVIASLTTREGIPLNAGDFYSIEIDDVNDIYIDSTVNGDGVTFIYYT